VENNCTLKTEHSGSKNSIVFAFKVIILLFLFILVLGVEGGGDPLPPNFIDRVTETWSSALTRNLAILRISLSGSHVQMQ
jgi:hypothetical protein